MKNAIYTLLLFTLFACNNEVSITAIEVSPSWRGTPGKLVVKKWDLVDTIYDGQFGYPPNYKLLNHLNNEYLFTSSEMNNGGDNYQTFVLWSLVDTTFLDTLFYKELNTNKEIQIKDKAAGNYNWISRKGKLKLVENTIVFEMDSIITLVENDKIIDTISFGRNIKYIKLIKR